MNGFMGPFEYEIDGVIHSWDSLDDYIKKQMEASKFTKENSTIYLCNVCVIQSDSLRQKNHDWAKVKRIFFNINVPNRNMNIIGIHPTNRKKGESADNEIPFIKTKVNLFKMLQFTLSLDGFVKLFSRQDRYSVMANFNRRQAQWVFSEGWEGIDFQLYLYIVVPNKIADTEKYIEVSIKSVRRRNRVLNNLTIWKKRLDFIKITDLKQDK